MSKALFSGNVDQNGVASVLIQHFDKKRVISTNGLSIFHAANVYKKIEGIGLTVDSKLTAILRDGALKFHSFHLLRQIFDVSEYYKEATDGDIHQFASMACVMVADSAKLIAISDTWVRRKLWLISQSQILEKVPVSDIKAVAAEFHIELKTEIDGRFSDFWMRTTTSLRSWPTTIWQILSDPYKSANNRRRAAITASVIPRRTAFCCR